MKLYLMNFNKILYYNIYVKHIPLQYSRVKQSIRYKLRINGRKHLTFRRRSEIRLSSEIL